ncbi:MAG: hypothetical protein U5O39_12165 [Gammaproteobacteria bacterium]|nr:hypothetical protein [Gammaproteobacteria bacterium]
MTREYLQEIKKILDDGGVLVANTFSTSELYDHESVTYREVFGPFFNFKMPITGNRVIIARENGLPADNVIVRRARELASDLAPYDVDIKKYPRYMSRDIDWDTDKRALTDQYSPANLLRGYLLNHFVVGFAVQDDLVVTQTSGLPPVAVL